MNQKIEQLKDHYALLKAVKVVSPSQYNEFIKNLMTLDNNEINYVLDRDPPDMEKIIAEDFRLSVLIKERDRLVSISMKPLPLVGITVPVLNFGIDRYRIMQLNKAIENMKETIYRENFVRTYPYLTFGPSPAYDDYLSRNR